MYERYTESPPAHAGLGEYQPHPQNDAKLGVVVSARSEPLRLQLSTMEAIAVLVTALSSVPHGWDENRQGGAPPVPCLHLAKDMVSALRLAPLSCGSTGNVYSDAQQTLALK